MGESVSWWWLIVIFGGLAGIGLFFRWRERHAFKKGRKAQSLAAIHETVKGQVSFQIFEEVWVKVGQAYSIDSGFIRPNDKLKTLGGIDSWDLSKGAEELDKWFQAQGLDSKHQPSIQTVLDIAKWVQSTRESLLSR